MHRATVWWALTMTACASSAQPVAPPPPPPPPEPAAAEVTSNAGGPSCESALRAHLAEQHPGKESDDEDPPVDAWLAAAGKQVLNRGTYLNTCGVASSSEVRVCAAVHEGKARGVTVFMTGARAKQADCVAGAVREMMFPSDPTMAIFRTTFAAQ
jgi:hypothetical protein